MKQVWCTNCGKKIPVYQKALPQYSRVIEVVQPHECTEELPEIEWDLTPFPIPPNLSKITNDKFIQKLDETLPKRITEPGDRRPSDQVKQSTVYDNVRSQVLQSIPSQPENDPSEDPDNG